MNYTEHYQLNQWDAADRVLMEDFNSDNRKIDAAIAEAARGNCRIAMGSYVGTGVYGADHPNSLTFDFEPLVLLMNVHTVYSYGDHLIWFRDGTGYGHPSNSNVHYRITWDDKTVSWYQNGYNSDNTGPTYQLNKEGSTYYYIAIGA